MYIYTINPWWTNEGFKYSLFLMDQLIILFNATISRSQINSLRYLEKQRLFSCDNLSIHLLISSGMQACVHAAVTCVATDLSRKCQIQDGCQWVTSPEAIGATEGFELLLPHMLSHNTCNHTYV